jgi:molybdate transport system ATP-binding protein
MGGEIIKAGFRGSVGSFSLDAAFEIPARGVTALFGPSGCGKTTVLRCIAGLNRLRQGFCAIDGEIWQDASSFLPTHKRPIGYVFQEASLFPHLSVRRNLLYGAGGQRRAGQLDAIRFDEVIDLLGLAALLDRAPRHLSGGERQRVAIGRALLSQPRLMLMDEPLSALDRQAKDEILPFLERLHESLSLPVVYVAHDMDEIERLADHLVLMDAGRVVAAGPLAALQSDPNLPLLKTRSAAVSLDAVVESFDSDYGVATLVVSGGRFLVPAFRVAPGESRRIRILASDVSLAREAGPRSTILNVLPSRILTVTPSGEHEITAILGLGSEGGGARLLARVTRRSWDLLGLRSGMSVHAQVKAVSFAPGRTGSFHG